MNNSAYPPAATQQNNFLCGSIRPQTQGTSTGPNQNIKGELFDDPNNNLHGDLDQLTKEDMKERLIVAEKVMKSLFTRIRELEDKNIGSDEHKVTATTSQESSKCKECLENTTLKKEIEKLKSQIENSSKK